MVDRNRHWPKLGDFEAAARARKLDILKGSKSDALPLARLDVPKPSIPKERGLRLFKLANLRETIVVGRIATFDTSIRLLGMLSRELRLVDMIALPIRSNDRLCNSQLAVRVREDPSNDLVGDSEDFALVDAIDTNLLQDLQRRQPCPSCNCELPRTSSSPCKRHLGFDKMADPAFSHHLARLLEQMQKTSSWRCNPVAASAMSARQG